jgi:predicted nucleic acid-binding protein
MQKIFLDTNILLDVILRRNEFYEQSAKVWADCETRKIQGFVSAISLNNTQYVLRKRVSQGTVLEYVRFVMDIFTIVPLDEMILRLAVDFPHKDFEDAIQTFSAVQAKADCIVTRDRQHFSGDYLPVLSPDEYLDIVRNMRK